MAERVFEPATDRRQAPELFGAWEGAFDRIASSAWASPRSKDNSTGSSEFDDTTFLRKKSMCAPFREPATQTSVLLGAWRWTVYGVTKRSADLRVTRQRPRGSSEPEGVLTTTIRLNRAPHRPLRRLADELLGALRRETTEVGPLRRLADVLLGALRRETSEVQGSKGVLRQSRRSPKSSSELDGARLDDRRSTTVLFGALRLAVGFQRPTDVLFGAQRAAPGANGVRSLNTR